VIGQVNGDLAVFGGDVHVHEGGEVHGDAALIGGSLVLDDGATIEGDVGVVGGSLKRSEKSHIGGEARDEKGEIKVNVDLSDDEDAADTHAMDVRSRASRVASHVGRAITANAFLFIFGAILLALGTSRMDTLKAEIAARPMRSFALGVVGSIGAVVAFIMLCVTVIGIPVAFVGLVVLVVAAYAGMTAALTTAGQAIFGHKTKNPYVHLAAGCVMLLVLGSLPVIGNFVWAGVVFVGIGTLVATRGAGLIPNRKARTPSDPYRTIADRG